jgi:ABC-type sugar transport system ATPase subunit
MGTPIEIYRHPANEFVARFMGLTNLVIINERMTNKSRLTAQTEIGNFAIAPERAPGDHYKYVLLRPQAIERIADSSERTENVVRGKITGTQWRGGQQRILIESGGKEFSFEWDEPVETGRGVVLELDETEIDFLQEA